ncbi:hypothetical protein LK09_11280 [Microbacterium mangrovi]|uniref:Uncharacterized protein n=1 Tax=Microbacterium mangrovi TaxID=1348253 RepID=A0A0B2A6Y9_9MICO|nr:hypothetical protein [Microbacterium mangrovi]KHK97366.1 hypothetical protein LK09_11280 [Microbacterium mangrovi]
MAINEWWRDLPEERYWMIAPSRGVVGEALSAPKQVDDHRFEWSHELVAYTRPGDTLFVWDRTLAHPGIAAWGRVLGPLGEETRARDGVERAHWRMPVSDTLQLANPITITALRRHGADVVAVRDALERDVEGPVYFPFIGEPHTLVPAPAYLAKVPRDLVSLLSSRFGFDFVL